MKAEPEQLGVYQAAKATALVAPDGSEIAIEFTLDQGQQISFSLSRDRAQSLLHGLSVGLSANTSEKTSTGGVGFVRMTPIKTASANVVEEPGKVSLCLFDEQDVPHYFVLSSQTSSALRPLLRSAESRSRSGAALPKA